MATNGNTGLGSAGGRGRRWVWLACAALFLLPPGRGANGETPHGGPALTIGIREDGLYRLGAAALAAAGAPLAEIDARTLKLYEGGQEVALLVRGEEQGRLDADGELLFYGKGTDSRYVDTNVYWLTWGGAPGRRWESRPAPPGGKAVLEASRHTQRWEENHVYGKLMYASQPGPIPHWFWALIRARERRDFHFDLTHLAPQTGPPRIEVVLWGNTLSHAANPDHHTLLFLNGVLLEDAFWDGQTEHRFQGEAPAALLREGRNTLTVECPGDTAAGEVDQVFLDWFSLTYDRTLDASQAPLLFQAQPGGYQTFRVQTAEGAEPLLLDLADARAPVRLTGARVRDGAVTFGDRPGPSARYLVTSPAKARAPAWVRRDQPSRLRSEGAVEYLVIAHDDLAEAVQPLVEWRRREGLRVRVARVSDVYDEFSHGLLDPRAVRDYIRFVYERGAPRLRFVLLVGSGNHDYRDYQGTGMPNHIPVFLARMRDSLDTPVDDWFACVEGDDHVPDVSIGRIPAQRPEEVATLVRKIIAYEQLPEGQEWQRRVLLVADHDVPDNYATWFERVNDQIAAQAESLGYQATRVHLRAALHADPPTPVRESSRQQIIEALQAGCAVVQFQGHGSQTFWSRQRVLTLEDTAALKNAPRLPVVLDISCFTGAFDKPAAPGQRCLAEAFLFHEEGGAVAYIAPGRLGGMNFDLSLWAELWGADRPRLGEMVRAARVPLIHERGEFWDPVAGYNLLGDPALRIKLAPPQARPKAAEAAPSPAAPVVEKPAQPDPSLWARLQGEGDLAPVGVFEGMRAPAADAPPANTIWLRSRVIDPAQTPGAVPENLAVFQLPPESPVGFIVQRKGPVTEEWKESLRRQGIALLEEVPQHAVVAWMTRAQARALAEHPETRWVGLYALSDRLDPALLRKLASAVEVLTITVELFRSEDLAALQQRAAALGGTWEPAGKRGSREVSRVRLEARAVLDLARLPEVAWIAEVVSGEGVGRGEEDGDE